MRLSLLGKFGVFSVVPFALLGVVLAHTLKGAITERTLATARHGAELTARLAIQPHLSATDLRQGLSRERLTFLDEAFRAAARDDDVARIKIWNRESQLVYAHDHSQIGLTSASEKLQSALDGRIGSEVGDQPDYSGERTYGRLLEVFVPLRLSAGQPPAGAFELYLPYDPIADAITHDTRKLYLILLAGLTLLYATLFRIVAGASNMLRRQAAENEYLALHDSLTALPNRVLFRQQVEEAIRVPRPEGSTLAVMIMDLDHFKEINDTLGHHTGDTLLQQFGARLRAVVDDSDTVARLSGDEFALLLPAVERRAVEQAAAKVREEMKKPFGLQGLALDLEVSIGVALYPEHGEEADLLVQRADIAMYVAKEARGGYHIYTAESDRHSPSRLALAGELRRAIESGELELHYQPKVELRDGRVTSVEALARWHTAERGWVPPGEFVPLAERNGLIRPLTLCVLEAALRQCRSWQDAGTELNVAVNLSVLNLVDLQLPDDIAGLLNKCGVLPGALTLEITESTIMADPERATAVLDRLSAMGVSLSVDDYGTGHSSLAYLKRLPIQEVKIDRSFVLNMAENENDATIVRSTIELGHDLGLRVVAEGVETEGAWNDLASFGCDAAQGHHVARPLPADALTGWLQKRQPLTVGSATELAARGRSRAPALG